MPFDLKDLWTAGGVLLGFQVTSFSWRISEEAKVGDKGDYTWIPPADILNLIAMLVATLGIFVLPVVGLVDVAFVKASFALSTLLFVGHSFAIAGHYELFNPRTRRSFKYFPLQEKCVVLIVALVVIVYFILLRRMA